MCARSAPCSFKIVAKGFSRPPWLMHKLNPIAMLLGTPMEDLKVKS